MLTSMQIRRSDDTHLLTIPIGGPIGTSPYVVQNADGLGPTKNTVTTSVYATQDGSVFQSSKLAERNIVLTIGYRPNYATNQSIQSLRQDLYKLFPTKGLVRLVFLNSEHNSIQIDGVVESVESPIFTQTPELQVSIICPDANFGSRTAVVLNGLTNVPIDTSSFGTAETGFLFDITMPNSASQIAFDVKGPSPSMVYKRSLIAGDRLRISTVRGNKYISLLRSGAYLVNEIEYIDSGSLAMFLQMSVYEFSANLITTSQRTPYTLTFTPKWLGV